MFVTGQIYRDLRTVLVEGYDTAGLQSLCIMLGINPQTVIVHGETINQAADRLITYCRQNAIQDSLISNIKQDRPNHPLVKKLMSLVESWGSLSDKDRRILNSVSSAAPQGVVTICFTDIEDYTPLSQTMDEQTVLELVKQHNSIIRECIGKHNGHEVKTLGDGFMIAFSSPCDAVLCALHIQCEFALRNAARPRGPMWVRIGLNVDEVIAAEEDYWGSAVNLASRICGRARGGQILTSDKIKMMCEDRVAVKFLDFGSHPLKGFPKDFHLFELEWHCRDAA